LRDWPGDRDQCLAAMDLDLDLTRGSRLRHGNRDWDQAGRGRLGRFQRPLGRQGGAAVRLHYRAVMFSKKSEKRQRGGNAVQLAPNGIFICAVKFL